MTSTLDLPEFWSFLSFNWYFHISRWAIRQLHLSRAAFRMC